jgi:hypothetical protein
MPYSKGVTRKTIGIDPKVPAQALTTVLTFVLAKYAIDLDAATSGAISVLLGVVISVRAPAPTTEVK